MLLRRVLVEERWKAGRDWIKDDWCVRESCGVLIHGRGLRLLICGQMKVVNGRGRGGVGFRG